MNYAVAKTLLKGNAFTGFKTSKVAYVYQTVDNFKKFLYDVTISLFLQKSRQGTCITVYAKIGTLPLKHGWDRYSR